MTSEKVFGPSTDYRDIRKAAYQEYLITTDFNVARLPTKLSPNQGASLGVAFVSALLALGISLGFNFAQVKTELQGPDLLKTIRAVSPNEIPEDVREECLDSIKDEERPRVGEWFAIWGGKCNSTIKNVLLKCKASSNTGTTAIQLAKLSGLRVIAVADLTRHEKRLTSLGADVVIDKHNPQRAIEIISETTKNELRFGLDTVGKETSAYLQEALQLSKGDKQAHLVGLTGLPKERVPAIRYHKVPIKVFHSVPSIGEQAMDWLEKLLLKNSLQSPEVTVAGGGLEGINDALDELRSGTVSGKRIVVPVDNKDRTTAPVTGRIGGSDLRIDNFEYADKLNADPSRIKFA